MHLHARHIQTAAMLLGIVACLLAAPGRALGADFTRDVAPLLKQFCFECHGSTGKPKGKLDLQAFDSEAAVLADRERWKDVKDALAFDEMPPEKAAQPTAAQRQLLVEWIEGVLARSSSPGGADPGKPVLRRLTRLEYNNTVRDLLGLDRDVFMFSERLPIQKDYFRPWEGEMPSVLPIRVREYGSEIPSLLRHGGLPGDNRAEHGFTNRGDAQDLSPLLLEKYLQQAGQIVEAPDAMTYGWRLRRLVTGAGEPALVRSSSALAQALYGDREAEPAGDAAAGAKPAAPVAKVVEGNDRYAVSAVAAFAANGNVVATAPGAVISPNKFTEEVAAAFDEDRGGVYDVQGRARGSYIRPPAAFAIRFGASAKHVLIARPSIALWQADFATADETSGSLLLTNAERNVKTFELSLDVQSGGDGGETLGVTTLALAVLSRRTDSGKVTLTAHFTGGGSQSQSDDFTIGAGADNTFFAFNAPKGEAITRLHVDGSQFTGTFVLMDDLSFIVGPYRAPANAPAAEKADGENAAPPAAAFAARPSVLAAATSAPPADDVKQRLREFLLRAFRRPATDADLQLYLRLYDAARQAGAGEPEALRTVVRGVLASPQFLYRVEPYDPDAGAVRELDDYELASRLSYFLWASMPDDELFDLAKQGKLRDPDVLEAQAKRMLKDPRSRELSESFAVQWLQLMELLSARPDRRQFRAFYSGPQGKTTLAMPMMTETLLLFETILVEDRSVLELLHADYTYVDDRLAELYGLEAQYAAALPPDREKPGYGQSMWVRVALPDARRGGVLTMGSTLTMNALPHRTSLIKRGAWVLEAVFNRPPPPPVANAGELPEEDRPGEKLTLRQKVEMHRARQECAVCHDRIDPPGFALEAYDAIGRWRESADGEAIDPSGVLPDGRAFDGPAEFKRALLQREHEFTRAFIEHLMSYALGRKLEYYDDATIKQINERAKDDGYRFSRVIAEIVRSRPFHYVRNEKGQTQ